LSQKAFHIYVFIDGDDIVVDFAKARIFYILTVIHPGSNQILGATIFKHVFQAIVENAGLEGDLFEPHICLIFIVICQQIVEGELAECLGLVDSPMQTPAKIGDSKNDAFSVLCSDK